MLNDEWYGFTKIWLEVNHVTNANYFDIPKDDGYVEELYNLMVRHDCIEDVGYNNFIEYYRTYPTFLLVPTCRERTFKAFTTVSAEELVHDLKLFFENIPRRIQIETNSLDELYL